MENGLKLYLNDVQVLKKTLLQAEKDLNFSGISVDLSQVPFQNFEELSTTLSHLLNEEKLSTEQLRRLLYHCDIQLPPAAVIATNYWRILSDLILKKSLMKVISRNLYSQ